MNYATELQLMELQKARQWLEKAIEAKGGEITSVGEPAGRVPADKLECEIFFKTANAEYWLRLVPHSNPYVDLLG